MSLEALTAQGWRAERHTLTAAQTYLWGILFALQMCIRDRSWTGSGWPSSTPPPTS